MTATSPQVGQPHPEDFGRPPSRGRRGAILAGCAVLGIIIGVAGQRLPLGSGDPVTALEPSPSASPTVVPAEVAAVSAKDSSFRSKAGIWESSHYATQDFGGLKRGIGLRLDLGQARAIREVTFTAVEGPITVELRAGDEPATDGAAYQAVGPAVQANGATSIPASAGGSHRYWMIWVTKLSPTLKAKIAEPTARG
jgi:hypothetical protein